MPQPDIQPRSTKVRIDLVELMSNPPNMGELREIAKISGARMGDLMEVNLNDCPASIGFAFMYIAAKRDKPHLSLARFDALGADEFVIIEPDAEPVAAASDDEGDDGAVPLSEAAEPVASSGA